MAQFLGIDIGTTGVKALLIDEAGRVVGDAHAEVPLSTPRPGWSEQNPEDWWTATQTCLASLGWAPSTIGLTGQMHGSVFLDGAGQVIRPALLWNDQRTAAQVEFIERSVGRERVREITANPPLTGFQLPKLLWLRDEEPAAYAQVRQVLLPKDYIRYRLSGEFSTDVSDASGTGAFEVARRAWSSDVFDAVGVRAEWFPPCFESDEIAGAGDQAASAVGTGAVVPGVVSVSLGTSGVVFASQDDAAFDPTGATHTFCHANRAWHRMGVMLSCGGALRWFRDVFAPDMSYDEIGAMAASVDSAEGVAFLPYLAGERCPWNRSDLTGAFVGLTLAHGRAHLARAVFEGMTMGIADGLESVAPSVKPDRLRVTGGGARSRFWRQLIADMTGVPVVTLAVDEGPAYGAALLAGVHAGHWPDVVTATAAVIHESATTLPVRDRSDRLAELRRIVREQIG